MLKLKVGTINSHRVTCRGGEEMVERAECITAGFYRERRKRSELDWGTLEVGSVWTGGVLSAHGIHPNLVDRVHPKDGTTV